MVFRMEQLDPDFRNLTSAARFGSSTGLIGDPPGP